LTRGRELRRLDRIQQFCAGQENDAGAREGQHHAARAWIDLEIVAAALNGAEGESIDDQPNLGPGLDGEQPGNLVAHGHW
jgi:hypothetical protein